MLAAPRFQGSSVRGRSIRILPGQYYDAETGLHYNYFRDYDPVIGRYVESDPIGVWGGLNTYAYVAGDPTRRIDPRGQRPVDPLPPAPNWPFFPGQAPNCPGQNCVAGCGAKAFAVCSPLLATYVPVYGMGLHAFEIWCGATIAANFSHAIAGTATAGLFFVCFDSVNKECVKDCPPPCVR